MKTIVQSKKKKILQKTLQARHFDHVLVLLTVRLLLRNSTCESSLVEKRKETKIIIITTHLEPLPSNPSASLPPPSSPLVGVFYLPDMSLQVAAVQGRHGPTALNLLLVFTSKFAFQVEYVNINYSEYEARPVSRSQIL